VIRVSRLLTGKSQFAKNNATPAIQSSQGSLCDFDLIFELTDICHT